MRSKIDILVESFEQAYPTFAQDTISYELSGSNSIIAELDSGSRIEYHRDLNSIAFLVGDRMPANTEQEWRQRFRYEIDKAMSDFKMDIEGLSMKTGISYRTIYNYLKCSTTPSCWNAKLIADALEIDVSKLI